MEGPQEQEQEERPFYFIHVIDNPCCVEPAVLLTPVAGIETDERIAAFDMRTFSRAHCQLVRHLVDGLDAHKYTLFFGNLLLENSPCVDLASIEQLIKEDPENTFGGHLATGNYDSVWAFEYLPNCKRGREVCGDKGRIKHFYRDLDGQRRKLVRDPPCSEMLTFLKKKALDQLEIIKKIKLMSFTVKPSQKIIDEKMQFLVKITEALEKQKLELESKQEQEEVKQEETVVLDEESFMRHGGVHIHDL